MSPAEFASRVIGTPWKKWHSSWDFVDCFGLIVLWHRHVLGIELGEVPQTDIAAGFSLAAGWQQCEPAPGVTCWMAWRGDAPTHCGVLFSASEVLHAEGSDDRPGNVRMTRLRAVGQVYGEIRFYRYSPC